MLKDIEPWDDEYNSGYFDENGHPIIHPSDAIYITNECSIDHGMIQTKKRIVSEIVENRDIIVEFENVLKRNGSKQIQNRRFDILHAFCIGIAQMIDHDASKKDRLQSIVLVPAKENVDQIVEIFDDLCRTNKMEKRPCIKTITEIDDILYERANNDNDDEVLQPPHIIISTMTFMHRVLSNQYVNLDNIQFILLIDNENIMKKMQEMVYYIPSTVKYGIIANSVKVEIPSISCSENKGSHNQNQTLNIEFENQFQNCVRIKVSM
jgi:hypothetical protein